MLIPDKDLENSTEVRLSSSVVAVGKDNSPIFSNQFEWLRYNFHKKDKQEAVFQFLFPQDE